MPCGFAFSTSGTELSPRLPCTPALPTCAAMWPLAPYFSRFWRGLRALAGPCGLPCLAALWATALRYCCARALCSAWVFQPRFLPALALFLAIWPASNKAGARPCCPLPPPLRCWQCLAQKAIIPTMQPTWPGLAAGCCWEPLRPGGCATTGLGLVNGGLGPPQP